jgi:hypothetical protein
VGLLALLSYLGAAAGGFCFGFLLCCVALCFRLVLLGLALASEVVVTSYCPDGLLSLAQCRSTSDRSGDAAPAVLILKTVVSRRVGADSRAAGRSNI